MQVTPVASQISGSDDLQHGLSSSSNEDHSIGEVDYLSQFVCTISFAE